jgi:hypothetical protein
MEGPEVKKITKEMLLIKEANTETIENLRKELAAAKETLKK